MENGKPNITTTATTATTVENGKPNITTTATTSTMENGKPNITATATTTTTMENEKPNITTTATTATTIFDLPLDMLELILTRIDFYDLVTLTLVSKSFLSLFTQFIRKLKFDTAFLESRTFQKIFARFSSVTEIIIRCSCVGQVLIEISSSQLDLKSLKIQGCQCFPDQHVMSILRGKFENLKANISFDDVNVDEAIEFIQLFPALDELNIGCSLWNEVKMEKLASNVPHLRKINLSRSDTKNIMLTDGALSALAVNCVNLEHAGFESCYNTTPQAFCAFLRQRRNLKSLDLPSYYLLEQAAELVPLAETVSACENLTHLSLGCMMMKDDILRVIAKSPSCSLKSLKMRPFYVTEDYSMEGLSAMLCTFRGLSELDIRLPITFLDVKMSQLVKSLPCLKYIYAVSYRGPMYATLFSLIDNCRVLECIRLNSRNYKTYSHDYVVPQGIRKNFTIKRISLDPPPGTLLRTVLESVCPSWIKLLRVFSLAELDV